MTNVLAIRAEISRRQDALLEFIIREYIKTAKPIPSSLICKKSRIKVSPATIRNEMNELEECGYLAQLHTSGGRVPTDKAYRHFVNNLNFKKSADIPANDKRIISATLASAGEDPRSINKVIADTISKLSGNLVITGIEQRQDFFKFGLANLMAMPEFHEFDRMFKLTGFFEEFDSIFNQFEQQFFGVPIFAQARPPDFTTIHVSIGSENPNSPIRQESVIMTRYPLPHGLVGMVTVIGPTRMDYEKNITLIKFTTDQLKNHIKKT